MTFTPLVFVFVVARVVGWLRQRMITPRFTVSQDERFVYVKMILSSIKFTEVDYVIGLYEFTFYTKPYYLKLTFENPLQDSMEDAKSVYDADTRELTVHLPKLNPGEFFPDLDMLSTLLARPSSSRAAKKSRPTIEVLSSTPADSDDDDDDDAAAAADSDDDSDDGSSSSSVDSDDDSGEGEGRMEIQRSSELLDLEEEKMALEEMMMGGGSGGSSTFYQAPTVESLILPGSEVRYGFNQQHSEFFVPLQDELMLICDSPSPDRLSGGELLSARAEREAADFDPEYYMADSAECPELDALLQPGAFTPWYVPAYKSLVAWGNEEPGKSAFAAFRAETEGMDGLSFPIPTPGIDSPVPSCVELDEDERETMMDLPGKEYLVDDPVRELRVVVELLVAYAYDMRTTGCEATVESAWTLSKIPGPTSWLDVAPTIKDAFVSSMRRCLIYPLYRTYPLAARCKKDALMILATGRVGVLKALLNIHKQLRTNEDFYYFNELYVEDLLVWIQALDDQVYVGFVVEALKTKVSRAALGDDLDLEVWDREAAARMER